MSLSALEFIRRFMLYRLPEGFFKIRYYGILRSRKKKTELKRCLELLNNKKVVENKTEELPKTYKWRYPKCKCGNMSVIKTTAPG